MRIEGNYSVSAGVSFAPPALAAKSTAQVDSASTIPAQPAAVGTFQSTSSRDLASMPVAPLSPQPFKLSFDIDAKQFFAMISTTLKDLSDTQSYQNEFQSPTLDLQG